MNPIVQSQARNSSRNVLKGAHRQHVTRTFGRQFQTSAKLLANDPRRNGADTAAPSRKTGSSERQRGRAIARRLTSAKSKPVGNDKDVVPPFIPPSYGSLHDHQQGQSQEESSNGPEPPFEISPFHGSFLNRRQRQFQDEPKHVSRAASQWFVENNVILRDDISQPTIQLWSKDDRIDHKLLGQEEIPTTVKLDVKDGNQIKTMGRFQANEAVNMLDPAAWEQIKKTMRSNLTKSDAEIPKTADPNPKLEDVRTPLTDLLARFQSHLDGSLRPVGNNEPDTKLTSIKSQYYINSMQDLEIRKTVKGLMKLPVEGSSKNELATRKSHLLLYYPSPGGDRLLESLVQRLAMDLNADLVRFDAHDVSDLIQPELDDENDDGRLLSYKVFHRELEASGTLGRPPASESEDADLADADDEDIPTAMPFGSAMAIGKPIVLDLRDMLRNSKESSNRSHPFARMFESREMAKFSDVTPSTFTTVVESILRSARQKRNQSATFEDNIVAEPKPLLVHIKDLRAIQDVMIGQIFLAELYQQVTRLRQAGEQVMIIGTDSPREWLPYSKKDIEETETDNLKHVSRTIVVTPVLPDPVSKRTILHDKQRTNVATNLRHLWSMMRLKDTKVFAGLEHGFWNDIKLHNNDQLRLNYRVLSFGDVHRLATVLAEEDVAFQDGDAVIDHAHQLLNGSDQTKHDWANQQNRSQTDLPGKFEACKDPIHF